MKYLSGGGCQWLLICKKDPNVHDKIDTADLIHELHTITEETAGNQISSVPLFRVSQRTLCARLKPGPS